MIDFKKIQKELYPTKTNVEIVDVPSMNFLLITGQGNPNEEEGEYSQAVGKLFSVAYALKMSYKTTYQIEDFYEYVVPPLEGFWWMENETGVDYSNKEKFHWMSLIRLPEFVKEEDVQWAKEQVKIKKKIDTSHIQFYTYHEGLCVQCLHLGAFNDEPQTVAKMHDYMIKMGYQLDISEKRFHHEIYLNASKQIVPDKMKTIIRHPIKKRGA